MRFRSKPFLAAVAAAAVFLSIPLPASAGNASQNMLFNSGFEETAEGGLAGWLPGSSSTHTRVTLAEHQGGNASVLCEYQPSGGTGLLEQSQYVSLNGTYELSAYVKAKTPALFAAEMTLQAMDSSRTVLASASFSLPGFTSNWAQFKVELNIPKNTQILNCRFTFGPDNGAFYLDDIALIRAKDTLPPIQLNNGGFENALSSWTTQGSGAIFTTTDETYQGKASASFSYFSSEPLSNYLEQTVDALPGTYRLSSFIKTAPSLSGIGAVLFLEALDANGVVLATQASGGVSDTAGQWKENALTLTAPAGTVCLRVKVGGLYCVGAFFVDNVALEAVP